MTTQVRGYRTHGSHGQRPSHAPARETAAQEVTSQVREDKRSDGFGAGIL